MLRRIGHAYATARQAVEARAPDADPRIPLPAMPRALALLALDPDPGDLPDRLEREAAAAGCRPVLVTASTSARTFLSPRLVAEHLPRWHDLVLGTGESHEDAGLYLLRRLQVIVDRWLVTECLWSGEAAADLVAHAATPLGQAHLHVRFRRLD